MNVAEVSLRIAAQTLMFCFVLLHYYVRKLSDFKSRDALMFHFDVVIVATACSCLLQWQDMLATAAAARREPLMGWKREFQI